MVGRLPPWIAYAVAAGFLLLALFDAWWIHALRTDLRAVRGTLAARDWQVGEDAERQDFADVHVVPLDEHDPAAKDPAFATAKFAVAWNSRLHGGVVTAINIPAPPAGQAYQLWVLDPGVLAPVNGGLLLTTSGSHHFTVPATSTDKVGFAISVEPATGSTEPSGPILFAVAPGQW